MNHDPESDDLSADEHDLAERLATDRPLPAAGFRGGLARYLAANDPGYGPRPERLRVTVALYLVAGLLLIALGVVLAVS